MQIKAQPETDVYMGQITTYIFCFLTLNTTVPYVWFLKWSFSKY